MPRTQATLEPPRDGRPARGTKPSGPDPRLAIAVGYCRRSTDRQEQSIPDQKMTVERYCADHGLRLSRFYVDDAVSGTSSEGRKAFQSLLADSQRSDRDFGLIVVYDVKRFGRVGNDEAGYYRHLLRTHGVEVRYATENFSGDGTDDLLRPVKQWQAREESKDLSKVTIRGLLSKSTTGAWMGGAPPYGYDLRYQSQSGQFLLRLRYNPDGTKLVLDDDCKVVRVLQKGESIAVTRRDHCNLVLGDEDRVKAIRLLFKMYVDDHRGFKAIADTFNRLKIPAARSPAWNELYSGQWAMTTVRAMLINPAYAGDIAWNRSTDARFHKIVDGRAVERRDVHGRKVDDNDRSDWIVVKDAHPAIIPRRMFELAQSRLEAHPLSAFQRGINQRTGQPARSGVKPTGGLSGPRAKFLLSGLAHCSLCGSRYEGYTQRGMNKDADGQRPKRYSYACGGAIRRGTSVCQLGEVRREAFESAVVEAVIGFYARYTGPEGRAAIDRAIRSVVGDKHLEVAADREEIARRLAKVKATIANLLDNITATNRAEVDARLVDLAKERDRVQEKLDAMAHLAMSQGDVRNLAAELRGFVAGLEGTLRDEDPLNLGERQDVVRRCVKGITIDRRRREARVELWVVPVGAGRGEEGKAEALVMKLASASDHHER